jgi:hypothetical protein
MKLDPEKQIKFIHLKDYPWEPFNSMKVNAKSYSFSGADFSDNLNFQTRLEIRTIEGYRWPL